MDAKRVFISYSHESPAHKDWVVELAAALRRRGVLSMIDRYATPDVPWAKWILNQIEDADTVIVVCTEEYRNRFDGKGDARGVTWETMIANQILYNSGVKTGKFAVAVRSRDDLQFVPTPYQVFSHYVLPEELAALVKFVNGEPEVSPPPVNTDLTLPLPDVTQGAVDRGPLIEKVLDGKPNPDAFVSTEVFSPVSGTISRCPILSTKRSRDDSQWDNHFFTTRELAPDGSAVVAHQSFMIVVESVTREPVAMTALTDLRMSKGVASGTEVKAGQKIADVLVPVDNEKHPPAGPTRGDILRGLIKFLPVLRSDAWTVKTPRAAGKIEVIDSDLDPDSGTHPVTAPAAGRLALNDGVAPGSRVLGETTLGYIEKGDRRVPVLAGRDGTIDWVGVPPDAYCHLGQTFLAVRVSAPSVALLISAVPQSQLGWFDCCAPFSGTLSLPPKVKPGAKLTQSDIVFDIRTDNVGVAVRISVLECEVMETYAQNGDQVDFGAPLFAIRATRYSVRSPMVGKYYSSQTPASPPFARVGDTIRRGQPVCIIEALKMMNEIPAPYDLKITSISVEDGDAVEWQQELMQADVEW